MKNKTAGRKGCVMFTAALLAAVLTACGSSGASYQMQNESAVEDTTPAAAATDMMMEMETAAVAEEYDGGMGMSYEASYVQEAGAVEQETAQAAETVTERKLIKTVDISVETEQFDTLVPALQTQVEQLGGYIEEISVYDNGSYYYESKMETLRCANMTARVPKDGLDSFLAQVDEQSNVVSRSERVEDVTLQYVDLDSHKRVLLSEQERLIELLSRAETVEDIIAIEGRLSEVRYQIESMESQLRTYDNKIDYSTVYLYVNEVRKYTPSQERSVWEKISGGFVNSLEDIGSGIADFFITFLINIPYIILWVIIIAAAVLILRAVIKKLRKSGKIRGMKFFARKKDKASLDRIAAESGQEEIHAGQTEHKEKEEHGE